MPRGNRMGPEGKGSGTGRGLGLCRGGDSPGYMNNRGSGRFHNSPGRGMGRGHNQPGSGCVHTHHHGHGIGAAAPDGSGVSSKDAEKRFIGNEISFLKEQLKTMQAWSEELNEEAK